MPIVTTVFCDCGCKQKLEFNQEGETPGAEELLQVTDALKNNLMFLTANCLRRYFAKYTCPYKQRGAKDDLASVLPGAFQ